MKILVVEDNQSSRYLLETLLTAYGHEVLCAPEGKEAIALMAQTRLDLIISDIMMPELDGFSLCYRVKSDPAYCDIPFIFYSASYTQPNDIRFALSLGADRFWLKPIAPEQLIADIETAAAEIKRDGPARTQVGEYEFLSGHAERMGQKLYSVHQRLSQTSEQLTQTQSELNKARRMLGLLVDHGADGTVVVDRRGRLLSASANLADWLENRAPATLDELMPAAVGDKMLQLFERETSLPAPYDFQDVVAIGSTRVFITATLVRYRRQQPALLLILRNLQGYAVLNQLQSADQYVFKNITEAVMLTDADNRIIAVNTAFSRITGYREHEALGKTPRLFHPDAYDSAFTRHFWEILAAEDQWQGEIANYRKNGDFFPEWLFVRLVRDADGDPLFHIIIFSDISAHEEVRRHIEYLAHYDTLTDLPNRTLVRYRLGEALSQAKLDAAKVALIFLDINRFKTINNAFGYQTGDDLIKLLALHLQRLMRPCDTVGRQGSDEFAVILTAVAGRAEIELTVDMILKTITTLMPVENKTFHLTASVGIAVFPDDGIDESSLIKNAGAALHKAKSEGTNNYQFYYPELNRMAERRRNLDDALYTAIAKNELRLVYQPQYGLKHGRLLGCEVLARWRQPELGEVSPGVFIPLAEETGQMNPIGDWILTSACRQIVKWQRAGLANITFAVNLSALQFRRTDFIQFVERTLNETGLPPRCLELELTEGILMHQTQTLMQTLSRLKKLGIELSIDDFGTGYSNLAYLNRFTVDKLKIDQSFIRGLPGNANDFAIVKAIIQMAHSLGLTVIAEGVETEAQRDLLRAQHCDMVQGYLFSQPLEADQFEDLLRLENVLRQSILN